jgi:hypothetical protein
VSVMRVTARRSSVLCARSPAKRSITFGIGHRLASSQRLPSVAPSISLLILRPCRCPANPITRCRRHSLATEILRAGASLAHRPDALLDREGYVGRTAKAGNHRRPAHPILSADRAADSRMTTRPRSARAAAARSEPLVGLLDAGNGRAWRLSGGPERRCACSGSGVPGRGGPGTFASTSCAYGRI